MLNWTLCDDRARDDDGLGPGVGVRGPELRSWP
jgi:hypothetical protein